MGKQLLTILTFGLMTVLPAMAYDVVNINYDEKTFEQLTLNTAAQIATNKLHNREVDSIKKKQSRLLALVEGIAAQKELMIQTYKNVSGFKNESKYYLSIVKTGGDIINHSEKAIEALNKSKLPGKVMGIIKVSDLVTQAISLGKAFSDIVANCEVPNPLKQSETGKKDKYNLLNRHERLYMANDILLRLRNIDQTLRMMIHLCRNSGWGDLLFRLDRTTYITYIMTNVNTNEIIRKWKGIKE